MQARHVVGKGRQLRDRVRKFKDCHAVAGPYHLAYEMSGGLALKLQFPLLAQTRIQHQRKVDGLLRLRLENLNFLRLPFLVNFKLIAGQIRSRPVIFIEHARDHIDQIHFDVDGPTLIFSFVGNRSSGGAGPRFGETRKS